MTRTVPTIPVLAPRETVHGTIASVLTGCHCRACDRRHRQLIIRHHERRAGVRR